MSGLKLYHFPLSGPSRGALLALRQVGLQFDIEVVDLFKKEQLKPEFIKVNPQHTVPTLVDGDFSLWDGHAIAMYLVNRYGSDDSLYPRDARQRAIIDHRLFFDVGVLYTRIRDICIPVLYGGETEVPSRKLQVLEEALGWVEGFLKEGFVAGSTLTIADTALLASISTIVATGFSMSKYPRIIGWLGKCEQLVKGWAENKEGATLFGEAVRSKLPPGQLLYN